MSPFLESLRYKSHTQNLQDKLFCPLGDPCTYTYHKKLWAHSTKALVSSPRIWYCMMRRAGRDCRTCANDSKIGRINGDFDHFKLDFIHPALDLDCLPCRLLSLVGDLVGEISKNWSHKTRPDWSCRSWQCLCSITWRSVTLQNTLISICFSTGRIMLFLQNMSTHSPPFKANFSGYWDPWTCSVRYTDSETPGKTCMQSVLDVPVPKQRQWFGSKRYIAWVRTKGLSSLKVAKECQSWVSWGSMFHQNGK